MSYKVKLPVFEGPLDLLLFLIKKEKIDIYDIPISHITGQYMEYLELMKLMDLEVAGEFLVVAATLIHIKSRMLLPPEETNEEEEENADPREELVRRLIEYRKFKEAASELAMFKDRAKDLYLRRGSGVREHVVLEDGTECFEASLFDLITAFRKALISVTRETFHKVVKDRFSVGDKIHDIYHCLAERARVSFTALFRDMANKDEVVATFLAVLELMKMREILVIQQGVYGDIEIVRNPEAIKEKAVELDLVREEETGGDALDPGATEGEDKAARGQ